MHQVLYFLEYSYPCLFYPTLGFVSYYCCIYVSYGMLYGFVFDVNLNIILGSTYLEFICDVKLGERLHCPYKHGVGVGRHGLKSVIYWFI